MVAVWAEEQLIVADEFRDGNVAGGEDPLSSAKRAFANLPPWVTTRYFRGDSASYYTPLMKYLVEEKIGFCISADMSQSLRERCGKVPDAEWVLLDPRERETVEVAEVEFTPGDWPKESEPLRYIALRITPLQAGIFETVSPKYLAVVSNRAEGTAGEIVRWHREKAGTIEHVHRVMKDELGAGVMPSGRFGVNAAWFRINALTFNVLTVLKHRALPERYRVARPKRLRFEVFTLPGRLAVHQNRLSVGISASEQRIRELVAARERLLIPAPPVSPSAHQRFVSNDSPIGESGNRRHLQAGVQNAGGKSTSASQGGRHYLFLGVRAELWTCVMPLHGLKSAITYP